MIGEDGSVISRTLTTLDDRAYRLEYTMTGDGQNDTDKIIEQMFLIMVMVTITMAALELAIETY